MNLYNSKPTRPYVFFYRTFRTTWDAWGKILDTFRPLLLVRNTSNVPFSTFGERSLQAKHMKSYHSDFRRCMFRSMCRRRNPPSQSMR